MAQQIECGNEYVLVNTDCAHVRLLVGRHGEACEAVLLTPHQARNVAAMLKGYADAIDNDA